METFFDLTQYEKGQSFSSNLTHDMHILCKDNKEAKNILVVFSMNVTNRDLLLDDGPYVTDKQVIMLANTPREE
jgi:hypothetical protein